MFQISAMININTKFEGSTNRPCAKRNEEQQELRRVCELQSKPLNFGLFVWSFRFVLFFFFYANVTVLGCVPLKKPDQDF